MAWDLRNNENKLQWTMKKKIEVHHTETARLERKAIAYKDEMKVESNRSQSRKT